MPRAQHGEGQVELHAQISSHDDGADQQLDGVCVVAEAEATPSGECEVVAVERDRRPRLRSASRLEIEGIENPAVQVVGQFVLASLGERVRPAVSLNIDALREFT